MLSGNTLDSTTLAAFLQKIETLYGKADRIWVMDRGIPTEESLSQMRASDPPVQYLVGTPKGRLSRLEQAFLDRPWRSVRDGVEVKLVPEDGEIYVLARSADRMLKERAMRRRKLKRLWRRLRQLQTMSQTREELLMRLGAARRDAGHAWRLVSVRTDPFSFDLNRPKLRQVRRREGRYLLRTNLPGNDPAALWPMYIQLTEVEQAFKEIKHDLGLRPIFHQTDGRIEGHIFVSFLAYCLQVTIKHRLRPCAPGLTPRSALEQMKGIQMLDVRIPTTDGRQLTLSRTTQPDPAQQLLLAQLQMTLPPQPPPKITSPTPGETVDVVKT